MSLENRHHEDDPTEIRKKMNHGESARGLTDNVRDTAKREDLKEGLRDFNKETGQDVSGWIKKLDEAKNDSEVREIETKMKKVASKWYAMQLKKSGAFEADDHRSATRENQELEQAEKNFKSLELTGEFSMISSLSRLEKDLQPRIAFKKNLSKQSKWVKEEYYRRLNSLEMLGSKQDLLNDILKNIEGLEKAPSALQYEFKKKQEKAKAGTDTKELRKEVQASYEKVKSSYQGHILQNVQYFGGKTIVTPAGKMPEAAWEFMEWFDDLDNFAKMEDALKKLPKLIAERKRLYERRDEVLDHAPKKDQEKLRVKTDLMRRHELEAYLDDLETNVRKNNIHTAEYQATLMTEKESGFPLFQPYEQRRMLQRFKLLPLEDQEARLTDLDRTANERRRLVQDFLRLPRHIQNEHFDAFYNANDSTRDEILDHAQTQEQTEKENPFKISNKKELKHEDADRIADALESNKGEKVLEDFTKELQQEGELKAAEIQEATYKKIFGTARRAKINKMTQKESYLDDLKYWIRLRKDVDDESDANNNKEKSKLRYIEAADVAHDEGFVFTSGGQVRELQKINKEELKFGSNSENVMERLGRAKYGEHVEIVDDTQSEHTLDPLKMIEDMSETEMLRLSLKLLEKLSFGLMEQSGANTNKLRNSNAVMKAIQTQLIDDQFSHIDRIAA